MADLKIDIVEKLVLNGVQQGGSHSSKFGGINDVYRRIITVPATSSAVLASFKSTVSTGSAAAMDVENIKYLRITNLNGTDNAAGAVNLGFLGETGNDDSTADFATTIKLRAQRSFLLGDTSASLNYSSSANVNDTLYNIESIIAKSSGSAKLEVFIAST